MMVRPLTDQKTWESFLARAQPPTFLQSWAWGETQRVLGEVVIRLGAFDDDALVGVAQAVTVTARRGKFLHVPHGPVMAAPGRNSQQTTGNREHVFRLLLDALRREAQKRGCAFLRVSPIQENTAESRGWYQSLGFRAAPIHLHAERLWILDLSPTEAELLAGMRKTTRNLIRRAERDGVTVRLNDAGEGLDTFLALYEKTAAREGFVPFPRAAIEAEVRACTVSRTTANGGFVEDGGGDGLLIGIAEQGGEPLAAAVVPVTPWSAFYHHGASSRNRPHVAAAYALQWALIHEARRRGCRTYNFWGVSPVSGSQPAVSSRHHPWVGLTTFKTGFGGREVRLVPTEDRPLSPGYWFAYAVDTARRWRRGY